MDVDEQYHSQANTENINENRNKIILFILNNIQSKIPIKQTDLNELGGKNMRLFKESFYEAKNALRETYGIHLKEVLDSKSGKKWICISDIPACSSAEYDKHQRHQLTLVFIIVSYIFMCDAPVEEEQLENFLAALGIHLTGNFHPYFGDNLKKLITETFVRQLYLKREKSASEINKDTIYVYSLGFRSNLEFDKKELLETTAKILGRPSKMFVSQYKKAHFVDEEEEEEIMLA